MHRNQLGRASVAALAISLLMLSAPLLHAALPQLLPTFSTPSTITYVQLYNTIATPDDQLAEVTLQGAYNQLQGTNRIYLNIDSAADAWWLTQSVPSTVTVSALSWTQTDPDGALKAMLTAYGSSIAGYIICDPINNPESCNMATTLAGIDDAMVVTPDNLAVMSGYPSIPLVTGGDLRTYTAPTGGQYTWVGSNSTLVGNTSINQVSNPSGGGGTTGWSTSCTTGQTLGTATFLSVTALKWTSTANQGTCWAMYNPGAGALGQSKAYVFSVQVAGSGNVYLDAWDGVYDTQSSTVALNSTGYQTLQITIPIPTTDNSRPVQIQVRANTSSNAVTAYFINAAVVSNYVAVDTYQYNNLIASTSTLVTNVLAPTYLDNRDYAIAAKLFTYYLGSTYADEKTLFGNVLNHGASNTPVIGWIKSEVADVVYLSGSGQDHFLTTTNDYKNGSVHASFAAPASLSQPAPAGIKAQNNYVYVAWGMSDGDNASFMQGGDQTKFTHDQWLGAVPVGWTSSPITLNFSPEMYSYYYKFLRQSNEMLAGPSGVSYETAETGTALASFATLSNQFMSALGMSSVNSWQNNTTDLQTFATDLNLPHVVHNSAFAYQQQGNSAGTVIDGQDVGYNCTPQSNIDAIKNYVSAHWVLGGAPLFVEALADNACLAPTDMLYVAEQLELEKSTGQEYVFLTPSESALTEANYHNSGTLTATSNAQAVSGTTLLKAYPMNYVQNGSGMNRIRLGGAGTLLTTGNHEALGSATYLQVACSKLYTTGTTTNNVIAQGTLAPPIAGGWYHFTVSVAGTGTVELGVYSGSAWTYSSVVTLSPTAFQTIDLGSVVNASGGLFEIILPAQTGAAQVYYNTNLDIAVTSWALSGAGGSIGSGTGNVADLNTMITDSYDYGPAIVLKIPANAGNDRLAYTLPSVNTSTQYIWSVDVAGSGKVFMDAFDGSASHNTSAVTLGAQYQTLSETVTSASSGTAQLQVRASTQATPVTVYIRNATVTKVPLTDFTTGLETGQTALTWTNTVDTTSPGGGESNVTSAVSQLTTSAMSHGGGNAIQYGGTASGGTTNYAYMEAFSNSALLSSTSRLNYWIFPQSPLGAEPGASSTTGLNSTCVAIDIIFTNSTSLRSKTAVTDQYGNQMHPAHMCNHLVPDQWNYVTADLSSLSGLTVSRIDVGYDQPNAPAGNYSGYVDDISLTH